MGNVNLSLSTYLNDDDVIMKWNMNLQLAIGIYKIIFVGLCYPGPIHASHLSLWIKASVK